MPSLPFSAAERIKNRIKKANRADLGVLLKPRSFFIGFVLFIQTNKYKQQQQTTATNNNNQAYAINKEEEEEVLAWF